MQKRFSAVSVAIALLLLVGLAKTTFSQSTLAIPHSSVALPSDLGLRAHTNIQTMTIPSGTRLSNGGPPYTGYFYEDPASLACIYGLTSPYPRRSDVRCNPNDTTLGNPTGGSQAIAIVDAYDDPNAASDLQDFSTQFDVSQPTNFNIVFAPPGTNCAGTGSRPPQDPTAGWEVEESLDIEYAHSMAPQAALYLVEAQSNSYSDLFCAVSVANKLVAAAGGGEISMSWGGGEFTGQTAYDSIMTTPKVVYFASAGDSPGVIYPATSPNVVSVGGTSTDRDPVSGSFFLESIWQSTGGGPSAIEPRPTYQNQIRYIVGSYRGTPDVALDANPNTGVWVLDNFAPTGGTTACAAPGVPATPCWLIVGGTSLSSPTLAGIVNAAGNFAASSAAELTALYADPGDDFNNVLIGNCGPYMGYYPSYYWSFCNGLGSPHGYSFSQKRK